MPHPNPLEKPILRGGALQDVGGRFRPTAELTGEGDRLAACRRLRSGVRGDATELRKEANVLLKCHLAKFEKRLEFNIGKRYVNPFFFAIKSGDSPRPTSKYGFAPCKINDSTHFIL